MCSKYFRNSYKNLTLVAAYS